MKKRTILIGAIVLAVATAAVVGCKKENTEVSNSTNLSEDRVSLQVAKIHNDFLSQIVKDFDYSTLGKSDAYEELHRCMRNLPCDQRVVDSIVFDFYENHYDVMDAASYYGMWKTSLNSSVLESDYCNKNLLVSYIDQTRSFLSNDELNYESLSDSISMVLVSAETRLSADEMQVLLAYTDVLKQSAYFWLPTEYGGSGEGTNLFNGKGKVPKWVQHGILADAESAAFAFCFGWWAMTNPAGLIAAGVGSVAASAYTSIKVANEK